MLRILCIAIMATVLTNTSTARAQRSGDGDNEVKKLQDQVDKLRAAIKEAEDKLQNSKEDGSKKELLPQPRVKSGGDESTPGRGRAGQGPEGFPPGGFPGRKLGGAGGLGGLMGKGFPGREGAGPAGEGRAGRGGADDVSGLEAELERLRTAAKTIETLTKEVEGRLKTAKELQETRSKEEARKKEEANKKEEEERKEERTRGERGGKNRERGEGNPAREMEKRLDRIERTLEEIQKEMRSKR